MFHRACKTAQTMTKTSVALCTYNGEQYIEEQILSILNQSHPIDEIVICDDGSSDKTITIIETIQATSQIPIYLFKNTPNLGVTENFRKAVSLCQGEIIFFSDQDDVWLPHKVERILKYLANHPSVMAVFSDALFIDSAGNHNTHYRNLFRMSFHKEEQKMFNAGLQLECFLRRNHATGATMAVRKKFIKECHPFDYCSSNFLHDFSIAIQAAERGQLGVIYQPLIYYRQHDRQQTGFRLPTKHEDCNWHCYYDHLHEYWPADEHLKSVENILRPVSMERIAYMATRNHLLHQILAPLHIFLSIKKYKHLYNKAFIKIMLYDITQSIRYSCLRLAHRAPSN